MRRRVIVSLLLSAGLAHIAPAIAQKPAEAPAAKAEPVLAVPNGQVMDPARQIAEADLVATPDAEVKPARVDPNKARKADFVPPRLAAAPAPAAAAPTAPKTVVAEASPEPAATLPAKPAAEPALAERQAEPQPAVTERADAVRLDRADRDPVVKPVYAERPYAPAAETQVAEHGDPAVVPRWKQRPWAPKPVQQAASAPAAAPKAASDEAVPRPDYARAERIVREVDARAAGEAAAPVADAGRVADVAPAAEAARVAEAPASAIEAPARVAVAAPVAAADAASDAVDTGREVLNDGGRAVKVVHGVEQGAGVVGAGAGGAAVQESARAEEGRDDRPVYADDRPARAEDARDERPVYADDDRPVRDERPAYTDSDRDAAPVYADDDMRGYPREEGDARPAYAQDDRDVSYPVRAPERFAYGRESRYAVDYCNERRFDGLDRAVRRAAFVGSIDWRSARDLEYDIRNGEAMEQNYCETGMNQWRAMRLDQQYAQIEERLRYERGGGRPRW